MRLQTFQVAFEGVLTRRQTVRRQTVRRQAACCMQPLPQQQLLKVAGRRSQHLDFAASQGTLRFVALQPAFC